MIDVGDILLPKLYVRSAIELTVENGYAARIGGVDAELLRVRGVVQDPEAYAISHIGWGLQPRARTTLGLYDREATTIGMDARAYEGNFLFSLGPRSRRRPPATSTSRCAVPCWTEGRGAPGQVLDGAGED